MKLLLDWSSYANAGVGDAYADIPKQGEDFAKAIAVCINSKLCQTKPKGVMCPSFRISDQALFSTGGRVQLLKNALNSNNPAQAFAGEQLKQTMALCVACKACKRECENEVDMAVLKIEYLAQRQLREGINWRDYLFATMPELLQRPGVNALIKLHNHSKWLRRLAEQTLGIRADIRLPSPKRKLNFSPKPVSDKPQVALFIDTFSRHFAPAQAQAAINVFEKAGYGVNLIESADGKPLCCGRTQLAHGRVAAAKAKAKKILTACQPYIEQNIPIIGLEPACLLAIRDDYKFLGLGPLAVKTASQAILFEEFIAKEKSASRLTLEFKHLAQQDTWLVHGHCHQKAVGAMKSMRKVLKMIPQLQFELIESSCCGMAGSFGLEKEHASHAQAMAEAQLLPRLREDPQAPVIANGFSCRHQIATNLNRPAQHIAQLLDAVTI